MYNFNHERYAIAIGAVRAARMCLEEVDTIKITNKRMKMIFLFLFFF